MSYPTHLSDDSDGTLLYLARRRAGAKLGWFIHASVYLCVNLALMALAWHQGRRGDGGWAIYPAEFWGLGLLIHGAAVWLRAPGNPWWQRQVEREMQKLRQQAPR